MALTLTLWPCHSNLTIPKVKFLCQKPHKLQSIRHTDTTINITYQHTREVRTLSLHLGISKAFYWEVLWLYICQCEEALSALRAMGALSLRSGGSKELHSGTNNQQEVSRINLPVSTACSLVPVACRPVSCNPSLRLPPQHCWPIRSWLPEFARLTSATHTPWYKRSEFLNDWHLYPLAFLINS